MYPNHPATPPGGATQQLLRAASDGSVLRMVVQGFSKLEGNLIDSLVKFSQKRTPRLELLTSQQLEQADVVLIDALDRGAMTWANNLTRQLDQKTVIWVDGSRAISGHFLTKRPVQWASLPMLLAKVLESRPQRSSVAEKTLVRSIAQPLSHSSGDISKVLVVDDSLVVRTHMKGILRRLGYEIEAVNCVADALKAMANQKYALVFMDVLMPEIDGYEGCKRIKGLQRTLGSIPVVMLTSRSSPFDRIRGKMSGCDGYLTKPIDQPALQELLLRFAGKPTDFDVKRHVPLPPGSTPFSVTTQQTTPELLIRQIAAIHKFSGR